jgi:hypothetical protein
VKKNTQGIFGGMKFSDFVFLGVLIANLMPVGYLGLDDYQRATKLSQIQDNGEEIVSWFEDFSQKLESKEEVTPAACVPLGKEADVTKGAKANAWKSCAESLFADNGPFKAYTNLLMPKDPVYAQKCDKQNLGSSGAFIFEKLIINPVGPPGVAPMGAGELIMDDMNIRLSVCDTGYYLIKIGEFKL